MKTTPQTAKTKRSKKSNPLITMKTTPRVLTLTRLIAAAQGETQYAVLERLTEAEWRRLKSSAGKIERGPACV